MKYKNKIGGNIFLYIMLILVILYYFIPLAVMISTSFKPEQQVLTKTWQWIPKNFTIENYKAVLAKYPFLRWLLNSVIVTIGTVLLTLFISLPAGYAFARYKFKGKEILFLLSLFTIMIPFSSYMPQLYILFYYMKLLNTYICLIIPLSTSAINLFLFRQFISQIPKDLDDAAKIDGCGSLRIFFNIILPLSKPAIISVVIFTAIRSWNSLMWPLVAASNDKIKTLPVGLARDILGLPALTMHQPKYGMVMASSLLVTIIPILLFLVLQRYFVEGISTTGLK